MASREGRFRDPASHGSRSAETPNRTSRKGEKIMKRIIAFCIVIFAISIFFAACGMRCDHASDAICNECSESSVVVEDLAA